MAQRLPRVPDIGNRLPRLESLFSPDTAPLATSMADAPMPLRCLDAFQPTRYEWLRSQERQPNGAWRLAHGLYEITLHSFCGMHATYAPHKALGYLPAPYKGRLATIFQRRIRRRRAARRSDASAAAPSARRAAPTGGTRKPRATAPH